MGTQQMTIDSEAVAAAVNMIDVDIADINTRNQKFLTLLDEKNAQTKGKFALIKSLKDRVEDETKNIQQTIEATEAIKDSLRRYEELAEEANDDSAFRV